MVFTVTVAATGVLPVTCTGFAEQEASSIVDGTVQVKLTVPATLLAAMTVTGMVADWPSVVTVVVASVAGTTVIVVAAIVIVICTAGAAR